MTIQKVERELAKLKKIGYKFLTPEQSKEYHNLVHKKWRLNNQEKYREIFRESYKKWKAKKLPPKDKEERALKAWCRVATKNALHKGLLKIMPCEDCGSNDTQAHHKDYRQPLKVNWLCPKHHKNKHLKQKNEKEK